MEMMLATGDHPCRVFGIVLRRVRLGVLLVLVATPIALPVRGAEPYIYPKKGQTAEQTEKDKYECYSWAKGQSGFDPMNPDATVQKQNVEKKGEGPGVVGGAAGGAVVGAVVGAIAGDAGKGAAVGAAGGGLMGGLSKRSRRNQNKQRQKEANQQYSQASKQARASYDRAFAACLEGRDYSVQ
jgi:hypothetical protein